MPLLESDAATSAACSDGRVPETAAESQPPLRGGARAAGIPELLSSGFPAPGASPHPPRKGEGKLATIADAGQHDPNGPIWKDGAFHTDPWRRPADDAPLPDGPAIVSKTRWLKERTALADHTAAIGLHLRAGESIDDLAGDLGRFAVIALDFPKFSDGRAFSVGRLLREKHGYKGELRATGNVLSDQIPFMRRVGFDAYDVTHAPTRAALAEGRIREVTLHYQPVSGVRPWDGTRP